MLNRGGHPLIEDFDENRDDALGETGYVPPPLEDGPTEGMDPAELADYTGGGVFGDDADTSAPPLVDAPPSPVAAPTNAPPGSLSTSVKEQVDDAMRAIPAPSGNDSLAKARHAFYAYGTGGKLPDSFFQPVDTDADTRRKLALAIVSRRLAGAAAAKPVNPLDDPNSPTTKALAEVYKALRPDLANQTDGAPMTGRAVQTGLGSAQKIDTAEETKRRNLLAGAQANLRLQNAAANIELQKNRAIQKGNIDLANGIDRMGKEMTKLDVTGQIAAFNAVESVVPGGTDITYDDLLKSQGVSPDAMAKGETFQRLRALKSTLGGEGFWGKLQQGVRALEPTEQAILQKAWTQIKAGKVHSLYGSALSKHEMGAADELFREGLNKNPAMCFAILNAFKQELYGNMKMSQMALISMPGGADALKALDSDTGATIFNPLFAKFQKKGLPMNAPTMDFSNIHPAQVPGAPTAAPPVGGGEVPGTGIAEPNMGTLESKMAPNPVARHAAPPPPPPPPPDPDVKVINGVKVKKINGKWHAI